MSQATLQFDDLFNLNIPNSEESIYEFNDINDSFGSCCSSPTQNSSSPAVSSLDEDSSNECYFFPATVKEEGIENHVTKKQFKKETNTKRKTECKIKRNERERRRVRRLADGFKKLQTVVPGDCRRLSKLETLKLALDYIKNLTTTLDTTQQDYQQYHEAQIVPSIAHVSPPPSSSWLPSPPSLSHPPQNWYQCNPPMYSNSYPHEINNNNASNVMYLNY